MRKAELWDLLILIFVFIFSISFPVEYFTNNQFIIYGVHIGLSLLMIIYTLNHLRKVPCRNDSFHLKNTLLLLPLMLICFTNFIFLLVQPQFFEVAYYNYFPFKVIYTLCTAILEELIFRKIMFRNFSFRFSKFKTILITSAIFAAFHLLNFFASFDPFTLLSVVYTFGLGIVLGFLYAYGGNVYACIVFHFLFNFLNTDLYLVFSQGYINVYFFIVAAGVTVISGIYLLLLWFIYFRKRF